MTITASTLRTIYQKLVRLPAEGKATMVGYLLKNTDSLHGTVSRGVCTVADGRLRSVREGKLDVSVLHLSDKWFGMTYQQDREIVAAELQKLHERATTLRICKNRKKEPESQHPRQLPRVLF